MRKIEIPPSGFKVVMRKHNRVTIPIQVRRMLRIKGGSMFKSAIVGSKIVLTRIKMSKMKSK
jgi:bifunctional DNA-binding transcriptional regulator/antitoxin component of YhaV-PrlF toxin-antitoxin module